MKKKFVAGLMAMTMSASLLAGCGGSDEAETTTTEDGKIQIE